MSVRASILKLISAVLAGAVLIEGCSTVRRVDDGHVQNGVSNTARAVAGGVEDLSAEELLALYDGEGLRPDTITRPPSPAVVSFYHLEYGRGGGGGGSSSTSSSSSTSREPVSGSHCGQPADLRVAKFADYDGHIDQSVSVDITDMSPAERERIPIAFHFEVVNASCGRANKVLLVDSLPAGFVAQSLEIEDLHRLTASSLLFSFFFGVIIAGVIVIAIHHGATMSFDDLAYDLKKTGDHQTLIVKADARGDPLGENDYFDLKLSGYVRVPSPARKP